jgi:acetate---CoA ligase (ADP-forming)
VKSAGEGIAHASEWGFPVVVKVAGRAIAHRSDASGVCLGVEEAGFEAVFERIRRIADWAGDAVIVQEQISGASEVLASAFVDPETGPVVLLRPGGVLAELLDEEVVMWGGWDAEVRRRRFGSSAFGRILSGYRGGRTYDVDALLQLVDDMLAAIRTKQVKSIEFNPVLVGERGLHLIDALSAAPA